MKKPTSLQYKYNVYSYLHIVFNCSLSIERLLLVILCSEPVAPFGGAAGHIGAGSRVVRRHDLFARLLARYDRSARLLSSVPALRLPAGTYCPLLRRPVPLSSARLLEVHVCASKANN